MVAPSFSSNIAICKPQGLMKMINCSRSSASFGLQDKQQLTPSSPQARQSPHTGDTSGHSQNPRDSSFQKDASFHVNAKDAPFHLRQRCRLGALHPAPDVRAELGSCSSIGPTCRVLLNMPAPRRVMGTNPDFTCSGHSTAALALRNHGWSQHRPTVHTMPCL